MLVRSIALAACFAISGCMGINAGPTVTGSGVAKSEDRAISGVTKINMGNVGTLIVKQSDKESLTVKGDDNIVPLLDTKVAGDTLTIGFSQGGTFYVKVPLECTVEVKSLAGLDLTGAVTAKVAALDGKSFKISMTGASKVSCEGKVDSLKISGTGACTADAGALTCKDATLNLTGASTATVNAADSLDVSATGACNVTYLGDPKVTKKMTGAGSVRKKQ